MTKYWRFQFWRLHEHFENGTGFIVY